MVADGARFTTRFAGLLAILARHGIVDKGCYRREGISWLSKTSFVDHPASGAYPIAHAAVFAHTAAGLHCALPPHISPAAAIRRHLAARNQARWLPGHCSQGRRAGETVQPAG